MKTVKILAGVLLVAALRVGRGSGACGKGELKRG
jgi:hypothetical protein